MSKRDDAFRKFIDQLDSNDVKLSAKAALMVFEGVWNARTEVIRSSDEQIAAALAHLKEAAAALSEGQELDIPFEMQKTDLDPKAYASDSARIRHTLVEHGVLEYRPAKASQYVKRITNGKAN